MMSLSNGTAKLSLLSELLPQDTMKQWTNMDLPPPELAGDATSCEEAKCWLTFAQSFEESNEWKSKIQALDTHLLRKSVLCGHGISITPVDIAVFLAVRDTLVNVIIPTSQDMYQNVVRWFDYIQNDEKVSSVLTKVDISKSMFEPQDYSDVSVKKPARVDPKGSTTEATLLLDSTTVQIEENKTVPLEARKCEANAKQSSSDNNKKAKDNKDSQSSSKKDEKKGKESNASAGKKDEKKADGEGSISVLDIRVGLVVKVWKHPSADSLLVEEIDLGNIGVRQVVSGLAKYLKEDELLNRKVVMIANVKPGKLRDVVSAGLVLCASSSDHSMVEPLIAPDGAAVGERITFAGHDGKPEEVLNPKKKQLEKILPDLFTDDSCVATYRGIPFMTSAGPCRSSLTKATIR